ncbi:hypothetical protein JN11_00589 [Mucilaginibacter frigoritolerans]|jgi:hypothetical protein|uniref:OmpL-like beta-barrel porin-2 n=1 Tax=Mucilaginibacter frigoritolerans TaxID=652788 RepID=A0A562UG96_9SPHI|nr:hypothetical protein [Mucilaginibacter frigoritolerans]TWJ04866.1 hypothetical protein JN11_00589 [Mucilaginibacter frigoritolerans]
MKQLYKLFISACLFILFTNQHIMAQGCVAIRSTGGICEMNEHPDSSGNLGGYWLYNNNDRYYKSFRHFIGKQEQFQRTALHNNVINKVFTQDNSFTRVFDNRWSATVDIPFADNSRSQVSSGTRFSTHSFGVGDISFTGYYWLFNPKKATKGNVQVGLGVKLATGADNYQDYFLNGATGARTLGPVDQSIQLGDGGTGVSLSINSYYNFTHSFGFYGNFFYLANPRDVNGTLRSSTPASATTIATTGDVLSVPDQYLIRFGADLAVKKFNFSLGVRDDCLPVHDLIGGSDGFRRPGYIIAAEPGITYSFKNIALYAYVPIAIIRDRTQSVPDIRTTEITGVYTHGDAAFADYVVNVGVTVKF